MKITFSLFLPVVSSEPAYIALHTLASAVPVKARRGNRATNAAGAFIAAAVSDRPASGLFDKNAEELTQ